MDLPRLVNNIFVFFKTQNDINFAKNLTKFGLQSRQKTERSSNEIVMKTEVIQEVCETTL